MFFLLLLFVGATLTVSDMSETPPPPRNVQMDQSLVTWTPALGDTEVTSTVQYLSFDSVIWADVPSCIQTSSPSCDVLRTKDQSEHGCATFRVRAQKHGRSSPPVKACCRYGDRCCPEVRLSARPGSLTVHLSGNHSLALEYGDHVTHRVYYGKEGHALQNYKYGKSSVTIPELQEGQRYCIKVQYLYFSRLVGLESCLQCEVIPETRHVPNPTKVIVVTTTSVFLVAILIAAISYIIIYKAQRIKQWLHPPCNIPEHFYFEPFPEPHACTYSISEEHFDSISLIQ